VAERAMTSLRLLHGVNLDMLGRRDPAHYGSLTLSELERRVAEHAERRGFTVLPFQTNFEGEMVEELHHIAVEGAGAVIINPGAWTHYSYALRDALEIVKVPVAEVHLSDLSGREEFRRHSVIADIVAVRVSGEGVEGYFKACDALADMIGLGVKG